MKRSSGALHNSLPIFFASGYLTHNPSLPLSPFSPSAKQKSWQRSPPPLTFPSFLWDSQLAGAGQKASVRVHPEFQSLKITVFELVFWQSWGHQWRGLWLTVSRVSQVHSGLNLVDTFIQTSTPVLPDRLWNKTSTGQTIHFTQSSFNVIETSHFHYAPNCYLHWSQLALFSIIRVQPIQKSFWQFSKLY